MNSDMLLIALVGIPLFAVLFMAVKFRPVYLKARKYGVRTVGTVVGYKRYYSGQLIIFPIIMVNIDGEEVIVNSHCLLAFPFYKIGEKVNVSFLSDGVRDYHFVKIFSQDPETGRWGDQQMQIDSGSKVAINDVKHYLDTIVEIIFIIFMFMAYVIK